MDKSQPNSDGSSKDHAGQHKNTFYKVKHQGISLGRFAGIPRVAAAKAFTKLKPNVDEKYKLEVTEYTDEHNQTVYHYAAERVKLDEPKTISIGDKTLTFSHQNRVILLNE